MSKPKLALADVKAKISVLHISKHAIDIDKVGSKKNKAKFWIVNILIKLSILVFC